MLKIPNLVTIGEKYGPAMEITDQDEADAYFEACVEHSMRFGLSRGTAEQVQRDNLGYYAGYYDRETRIRVERLFHCAHPTFGKAEVSVPTALEAFQAGIDLAEGLSSEGTCPKCGQWFAVHNDDGSCVVD